MTWTGWCTVQDVSGAPVGITVVAVANAEDKVRPFQGSPYKDNPAYVDQEVPALSSNTEGNLRSVEVRFTFNEDEPPLAVGDLISVNGHFTRRTVTGG